MGFAAPIRSLPVAGKFKNTATKTNSPAPAPMLRRGEFGCGRETTPGFARVKRPRRDEAFLVEPPRNRRLRQSLDSPRYQFRGFPPSPWFRQNERVPERFRWRCRQLFPQGTGHRQVTPSAYPQTSLHQKRGHSLLTSTFPIFFEFFSIFFLTWLAFLMQYAVNPILGEWTNVDPRVRAP